MFAITEEPSCPEGSSASYQLASTEPLGRVGVETNDVLSRRVGREAEATLRAVHLGEDRLILGVPDLDVHANARARHHEAACLRVKQLTFVVSCTRAGQQAFFLPDNHNIHIYVGDIEQENSLAQSRDTSI